MKKVLFLRRVIKMEKCIFIFAKKQDDTGWLYVKVRSTLNIVLMIREQKTNDKTTIVKVSYNVVIIRK